MGLLATLVAAAVGAAAGGGEQTASERPRCAEQAANCVALSGSVLAVERLDPDGDGDAHFVLLDSRGLSAPGVSIVDVSKELRPRPLPGPGDVLFAAGPVYRGSYGQRQLEADDVSVGVEEGRDSD